jgi:hypothetical protein
MRSASERWYERGREDAKRWAVSTATREELWHAADELEGEDGEELADTLRRRYRALRRVFGAYDFAAALSRWTADDRRSGHDSPSISIEAPATRTFSERDDDEGDKGDEGDDPDEAVGRQIAPEVDLASYMEGWRDSVRDIWQIVAKALRR